jgi:glycosyl transferase, family 25
MINNFNDIQHIFYINLKHREDRQHNVITQLNTLNVIHQNIHRFDAISHINGAVGCAMSHLACLTYAKKHNWDNVLIIEDDIVFLNPNVLKCQFNKFLSHNISWDVIIIGGNNIPPYKKINDCAIKVSRCQTTTGYVVKSHYYDKLIDNFTKGIKLLLANQKKHYLYAIDKYWFHLQQTDNWFLIIPTTVTQLDGYSDIEKRKTYYTPAMLDINKINFLKQIGNNK